MDLPNYVASIKDIALRSEIHAAPRREKRVLPSPANTHPAARISAGKRARHGHVRGQFPTMRTERWS
jgi:hypothetical protein